MAATVIFLLSGTTWTVPNDWNNGNNSIECIGGGGGGSAITSAGGGAYSKVVNQTYTAGANRTIAIGAAGAGGIAGANGGDGGDTSILQNDNATTACLAKGGLGGAASSGSGGAAGSGTGTTKNSGGNGGAIGSGTNGGSGGGGAAGPNGDGKAGGSGEVSAFSGGGGGGANNGAVGANGTGGAGGAGGNGRGGSGGGAAGGGNATAGLGGGGGGGAGNGGSAGGAGGTGAQDTIAAWVQTSDSSTAGPSGGGGGGAGGGISTSGAGGNSTVGYGGGGGAGGASISSANGGNGRPGIIVITYTPATQAVFTRFDPGVQVFPRTRVLRQHLPLSGFEGFIFVPPVVGPPTPTNLPYFSPFDPPAKPPRHAVDAITFTTNFAILSQPTTYAYTPFDPPPKPPRHAVDWIAFSGNYTIFSQPTTFAYTPFSIPPKPPQYARDWIAFSGNVLVETLPISSVFSFFDPPAKPPHRAVLDWIAPSFQFATIPVPPEFSPFDPPAKPPHHAIGWMTWDWFIGPTQTPGPEFGFYMPFSPGRTAKPFGMQHQPQWWTYDIKAQFFRKRDTHDGPLRRHPPVYSDEYYDSLRKRREKEQPQAPAVHIPNLLIPLNRLILPIDLPTLLNLPPYRPVPTLTMNPPPFRMATPEEIAMDDEMIIRMLLEE